MGILQAINITIITIMALLVTTLTITHRVIAPRYKSEESKMTVVWKSLLTYIHQRGGPRGVADT